MTREVFECHATAAVSEKTPASTTPPAHLTAEETLLYRHLLACERGRLEQEFLSPRLVQRVIKAWADGA
jgi:hypothetical protein